MSHKNVLVVSYWFPPLGTAGSVIRLVKHIKYLRREGWLFCVLTADREHTESWHTQSGSAGLLSQEVPEDTLICRARAWSIPTGKLRNQKPGNGASVVLLKGLSAVLGFLRKRLRPASFLFPDAYIPWLVTAVPAGIRLVHEKKARIIYAVAPPTTAIVVGFCIACLTGRPLVVDFKDDRIGTKDFERMPLPIRILHQRLEHKIVDRASAIITVTPSSYEGFRRRYISMPESKFALIPNGVDIQEFTDVASTGIQSCKKNSTSQFMIINAGGYAPAYRNAGPFLEALIRLLDSRPDLHEVIRVHFIGRDAASAYGDLLTCLGDVFVEDPPMPRKEYISALCGADLLLLIQTLGYPTSIAGTFYEYWAAGRAPIFIIGEPGDMWSLLHTHQLGFALHHNDVDGIRSTIEMLVDAHLAGRPIRISANGVEQYDRRYLASQLGDILTRVVNSAG